MTGWKTIALIEYCQNRRIAFEVEEGDQCVVWIPFEYFCFPSAEEAIEHVLEMMEKEPLPELI